MDGCGSDMRGTMEGRGPRMGHAVDIAIPHPAGVARDGMRMPVAASHGRTSLIGGDRDPEARRGGEM